jgi:hypothetical protein
MQAAATSDSSIPACPYPNMICGFGVSFPKDFVARAENNRTTIGSASINAQPEFIDMIAQHSKIGTV